MRRHRLRPPQLRLCALAVAAAITFASSFPAHAQSIDELLSAVVRVKTFINPDGRTVETLGRDRDGSGVVIDNNGLIVTIGYIMVEAHAAEVITNDGHAVPANVVGYDHETGFGLLQAITPLKVKPMPLGKSADVKTSDPVVVASFGGQKAMTPARVVARREFAGNWEYLLDNAIFTAPPHPAWSGAALIDHSGKLVGVGSLVVSDSGGNGEQAPGNMFVPIDLLTPILGDLIAEGRPTTPPHPWLGLGTSESGTRLVVSRVVAGGPAEKAGLRHGDVIAGVAGQSAGGLVDFYRKIWALGPAGVVVSLDIVRGSELRHVDVTSMNRLDHLRLKSTF